MSAGAPRAVPLDAVLRDMIRPALAMLPARMTGPQADVMLLAIGLQESRFRHRRQIRGPARGYWQFEQGGGVRGVLVHPATRAHARRICEARDVLPQSSEVYAALEYDDVLAAAFARLLLWSDPEPLPKLGDTAESWALYLRVWRPGKPHHHTWGELYHQAYKAVGGAL